MTGASRRGSLQFVLTARVWQYYAHTRQRFLAAAARPSEDNPGPAAPGVLLVLGRDEWEIRDEKTMWDTIERCDDKPLAAVADDGGPVLPSALPALTKHLNLIEFIYFVLSRLLGVAELRRIFENAAFTIDHRWLWFTGFMANPVADEGETLLALQNRHASLAKRGSTLQFDAFRQRHPMSRLSYPAVKANELQLPYFLSHAMDFLHEPVFALDEHAPYLHQLMALLHQVGPGCLALASCRCKSVTRVREAWQIVTPVRARSRPSSRATAASSASRPRSTWPRPSPPSSRSTRCARPRAWGRSSCRSSGTSSTSGRSRATATPSAAARARSRPRPSTATCSSRASGRACTASTRS